MYCSNCGKKLADGDYFCPTCGTPVSRQGLFDEDVETEITDEDFDETKIFDSDALNTFLNDDRQYDIDEDVQEEDQPIHSFARFLSDQPRDPRDYIQAQEAEISKTESQSDNAFITGNADTLSKKNGKKQLLNAFGAMTSLLHNEKTKKDQNSEYSLKAKEHHYDLNNHNDAITPIEESEKNVISKKGKASSGGISMRKMILPIIVIGLIIGLVVGMTIVKPWKSENRQDTNAPTGVIQTDTIINAAQ